MIALAKDQRGIDVRCISGLLKLSLEVYSPSAQVVKAAEEASELSQALCKYTALSLYQDHAGYSEELSNRILAAQASINEEIADVEIMIAQLKYLGFGSDKILLEKLSKCLRLIQEAGSAE